MTAEFRSKVEMAQVTTPSLSAPVVKPAWQASPIASVENAGTQLAASHQIDKVQVALRVVAFACGVALGVLTFAAIIAATANPIGLAVAGGILLLTVIISGIRGGGMEALKTLLVGVLGVNAGVFGGGAMALASPALLGVTYTGPAFMKFIMLPSFILLVGGSGAGSVLLTMQPSKIRDTKIEEEKKP